MLHYRGPNVLRVQEFVNSRIGSVMIQHSDETKYIDHSEQPVDAFGPNGEDVRNLKRSKYSRLVR